jgi:citrate lyase subunit alpha / citrate CoA-transferase
MTANLPAHIDGYGPVRPYTGPFDHLGVATKGPVRVSCAVPGKSKVLPDIRAAIEACGLRDGGVVSFHHHLRNGDRVLNCVVDEIARLGIRDITVAPSSLFPVHAPLVEHIRTGVVARIHTAYISGPVAQAVARGALAMPVVM